MTQQAVFFDRDGTLIIDKHYMHKVSEIEYFKDSFSALKRLQDNNFKLFIVTNQSGIGRGMFDETQMHEVHIKMIKDYKENGIEICDVAFCPHAPEDKCECRKPSAKLLLELAKKHKVDLARSYMIGDKISDAIAGANAGCEGLLLNIKDERYKDFQNLTQTIDYILK